MYNRPAHDHTRDKGIIVPTTRFCFRVTNAIDNGRRWLQFRKLLRGSSLVFLRARSFSISIQCFQVLNLVLRFFFLFQVLAS